MAWAPSFLPPTILNQVALISNALLVVDGCMNIVSVTQGNWQPRKW